MRVGASEGMVRRRVRLKKPKNLGSEWTGEATLRNRSSRQSGAAVPMRGDQTDVRIHALSDKHLRELSLPRARDLFPAAADRLRRLPGRARPALAPHDDGDVRVRGRLGGPGVVPALVRAPAQGPRRYSNSRVRRISDIGFGAARVEEWRKKDAVT